MATSTPTAVPGPIASAGPAPSPLPPGLGLRFTETMRGFISTQEMDTYEKAFELGEKGDQTVSFTVTITSDDLEHFVSDKFHKAMITGTVTAKSLSPQPMNVTDGNFNLFVDSADVVNCKEMRYSMKITAADGTYYYLFGFKTIRNDPHSNIWTDTTTLRMKIYRGEDSTAPLAGMGMLHIAATDFLHQLTTIQVFNAKDKLEELRGIARFGTFFAGDLFHIYGGVFARPSIFNPDAPPRQRRPLQLNNVAPEVHTFDAGDGVMLRLTRYRGGAKGPLMCVHGLGVSSQIFSTDLIDRNLLEELVAHEYDVWLLDYRSSIDLPYAATQYTADDVAKKDYPAAVKLVLSATGAPSLQCLVHCFGATTFFMAMLAGLEGVRSVAVSQIAIHVEVPLMTDVKARFHAANFLDVLGVKSLTAYVDTHEGFVGKVADTLLKFYPVHDGPGDTSPVSRRISFLYGQLYQVDQLNETTYANLHELFGVAGIASLEHLAMMIRHGKSVNFKGEDVYLREAEGMPTLKRLAIPILIVHGAENKCWKPNSTEKTIELLKAKNDPALYNRIVVPAYGHIDCIFGKNAVRDVAPLFIAHLDKTARV